MIYLLVEKRKRRNYVLKHEECLFYKADCSLSGMGRDVHQQFSYTLFTLLIGT